ncbi:MAG: acyltransferase family protein [Sphingomicrobium sp.]
MRYRADIDGLRAVAVVPIVLFHCGLTALSGGFVGVDIFFVISGFLITTIIVRDMDEAKFSILAFYRRRIVRIFPALFAMLILVVAAGAALLLPPEVRSLSDSGAATAAFVSNIFFWRDAGYFGGAAVTKPLLHTWSLGVEEQFYLFYPPMLLLVRRLWPGGLRPTLVLVAIVSFAVALFGAWRFPDAGFYLLPCRAWELAIGGLVALGAFPNLTSGRARSGASLLGLTLIIVGYLVIRDNFWFPAPWALLPCAGSALLIAYGRDAATARLLTMRVMRGLGAVSYSLYLWHWPIVTFYRLLYGNALPGVAVPALALASLGAATLSYFIVEQPFLRRFRNGPASLICGLGVIAIATMAGAGIAVSANAARFRSIPPEVGRVAAYLNYESSAAQAYQFRTGCFVDRDHPMNFERCLTKDPTKRNVLLLGDSHAAHLWRALQLRQPDIRLIQATATGCRPIVDTKGDPLCVDVVRTALGPLLADGRIKDVILAGRWVPEEADRLERTVKMLRARHIQVTVLGPIVEYEDDFPKLLARGIMQGDPHVVEGMRDPSRAALDRSLEPRLTAAGARYISMQRLECPTGRCRLLTRGGAPYQSDYGHLTLSAAREIVTTFPRF